MKPTYENSWNCRTTSPSQIRKIIAPLLWHLLTSFGVKTIAILEALAAANAAVGIIKQAAANGREGVGLIAAVGKFINAEEEVKEKIRKKKASPITAITGASEESWAEFQAQETLREQRAELISYMRLYCRAGTYDRFLQWEAEARRQRAAARKAAEQKRQETIEALQLAGGAVIALSGIVSAIFFLGRHLGKW